MTHTVTFDFPSRDSAGKVRSARTVTFTVEGAATAEYAALLVGDMIRQLQALPSAYIAGSITKVKKGKR